MPLWKSVPLRFFSIALPVAVLAFVSLIGLALYLINHSFQRVEQELARRQQTLALTTELTQITNLLARLARAFAATGDTRYLTFYYELAEYRIGNRPAPSSDPMQYWEEVIAGSREHISVAEVRGESFSARMRKAGFASVELIVLDHALSVSDEMHKIEQIAFAATQGLYDPDRGEFVSDGKPQIAFALKLLHSAEYAMLQARMTREVDKLARLADARTNTSVKESTDTLLRVIVLAVTAIGMLFGLTLLASLFLRQYLLRPLQEFAPVADRIATGDYKTRLAHPKAAAELQRVAFAFNKMAAAVEDDVEHRKAVQVQLEEARTAAESATRAKSIFLANMSHEIRTPMNAIIGMAYLALKTPLEPRQRDYINRIHEAGKSLLNVINDILDFSKIEAGRVELERIAFDLPQTIATSLLMVRDKAAEKGIELVLDMAPELIRERRWVGDGLRLSQVLTNLLSNAVKFTHRGHVALTAQTAMAQGERQLRFSIEDTGIGMTPEQTSRLFEEFTQADGSTTRKYGGTGLGLAICKRLVTLMQGQIELDSEIGRGTCFRFTVRCEPAEAAAIPKTSGRALVIDPLPQARTALIHALEGFGIEVEQAADAEQAAALLARSAGTSRPVTIAFVDWEIVISSGEEIVAASRTNPGIELPRLVAMSSNDGEETRSSAVALGFVGFLPKPILPGMLEPILGLADTTLVSSEPMPHIDTVHLAGMYVLLVEDQPINQQLTVELLGEIGVTADVAEHGLKALEVLAAKPADHYAAVLMDLQMPILDGYETTKRIRADARYAHLPIIAMTAHMTQEERERCTHLGMNAHIGKPIDPRDLHDTLARYCQERALRRVEEPTESAPALDPTVAVPGTATSIEVPPLPGVDVRVGLGYAANKPALYSSVLQRFAADFANAPATLRVLLETGRREEAARLAHSLAGIAGSIGAASLGYTARRLQCAIEDAGAVAPALEAVDRALIPLTGALTAYFGLDASSAGSQADDHSEPRWRAPVEMPGWMDELRRLLLEGDIAAQKVWLQRSDELEALLPTGTFNRVRRAVEDFDFATALDALTRSSESQMDA